MGEGLFHSPAVLPRFEFAILHCNQPSSDIKLLQPSGAAVSLWPDTVLTSLHNVRSRKSRY